MTYPHLPFRKNSIVSVVHLRLKADRVRRVGGTRWDVCALDTVALIKIYLPVTGDGF